MKKIYLLLCFILAFSLFTGCGSSNSTLPETESNPALEFERERYNEIDDAIEYLRDNLKNPSTLEIHEIVVKNLNVSLNNGDSIFIRFSADNDLGGTIDDILSYHVKLKSGSFNKSDSIYDTSVEFDHVKTGSPEYDTKIEENFYTDNDDLSKVDNYIFKIDLNDYEIPDMY